MKINITSSLNELENLKKDWSQLSSQKINSQDYYLSYNWLHALISSSQNPPDRLYILSIYDNQTLIAVLPLCINTRKKRGITLKSLEFIGNIYSPLRGGTYLSDKEPELAANIVRFLFIHKKNEWDVINFSDLSEKDPLTNLIIKEVHAKNNKSIQSEPFSNILSNLKPHPNSEAYFKSLSKKLRQTIRTGINRANKDFDLSISLIDNPNQNIDLAMDQYYEIYNESWKVSEEDPDFHRKLAHHLVKQGKLKLFILYSHAKSESTQSQLCWDSEIHSSGPEETNGTPIAAIFMITHQETAYYLKTSYKQSHSKYSTGMILFWHAVKYLMDKENIRIIDHQKGADPYKFKWGVIHESRFTFQSANPTKLKAKLFITIEGALIPYLKKIRDLIKPAHTGI